MLLILSICPAWSELSDLSLVRTQTHTHHFTSNTSLWFLLSLVISLGQEEGGTQRKLSEDRWMKGDFSECGEDREKDKEKEGNRHKKDWLMMEKLYEDGWTGSETFRSNCQWSFTRLALVPGREATLSSAGVLAAQTAAGCYCHISSTNQWTVSANACKEPINPNWGWHERERWRGEGEWEDMYSSNKQALSAPPRGSEQKSCFLLHADKRRLSGTLSSARMNTKKFTWFRAQPHILFVSVCNLH